MSIIIGNNATISGQYTQDMAMSDESKKHNHSEIEKRRRDKMNHYITELSCLIPMCNAISRKLDKLTVLRMAVHHMRTIKGNMSAFAGGSSMKPNFLSDEMLLELILQISEGFLFVVSCDRGRILFVSESVSQVLNYSQTELLGQNWFDILHPKDVAKVKEQLSSSDLSPKERLIDAKTMLPVKTGPSPSHQANMCPGARRSFFCRMKYKSMSRVKQECDANMGYGQKRRKSHNSDRKYCVIHCIGYLKSWISTKMSVSEENETENDIYNMSCLVAIGCTLPNFDFPTPYKPDIQLKPMNFISRHTIDGKFLFVDQSATLILGYLPQELLGTCCYEYCHPEDLKILAESHRLGLQNNGGRKAESGKYRFKVKSGSYIYLKTSWKTFRNPWTKEFEFLVAINSCAFERGLVDNSNDNDSIKSGIRSSSSGCSSSKWDPQDDSRSSSAVDEILFRIKDSCASKSARSSIANGGSSTEHTSTGYSSTETKSVQKMLASSRVALWKIGRYIADEVLETQRRNENTSCISDSSYSSSPTSNETINYSTDAMMETLNKWKTDRRDIEPLANNDNLIAFNSMWPNSGTNTLTVPSAPQVNLRNCPMNNGSNDGSIGIVSKNRSCMMVGTCRPDEGEPSSCGGEKNPQIVYCQEPSNYDPLISESQENLGQSNGSLGPRVNDNQVNFYQHHQRMANQLSMWTDNSGTESGVVVGTPNSANEHIPMDQSESQSHHNQISNPEDQENEDAAMDLIMSILEADSDLGGPVNPEDAPCPWI
ncbi:uncharacterized protein LOC141858001 [Brevipalpus obovatus]|uniref:uncharacterized protein LOC141858001 n=1 Tax=Brevipalpus obovatus TaxID=246614 RepID=UPI003D9F94AC